MAGVKVLVAPAFAGYRPAARAPRIDSLGPGFRRGDGNWLVLCCLAFGLACGGKKESGVAVDGPYAKEVGLAVPKVERASGLTFKRAPKVEGRSKDQVRQFLEKKFNEEMPTREIAGLERAYKRLGLIPDSLGLRPFLLNLLSEQVVGFYDPGTKTLYIVEGSSSEMRAPIIEHELVHALQDQYVNLDSIQKQEGDNDRQSAAQSVIEGHAQYESMKIMLGGGDVAARIPGGWDRIRQTIREQQSSMPVFANAPMFLQETLLFPYINGAEFVRRFEASHPGRAPLDSMPVSTEQVMHEDKYASHEAPVKITLPAPRGGSSPYENNLGEFETRLYLFQHLQDVAAASRGATGWAGDRYVVFTTGAGDGIAWLTVWDSPVDAGEFNDLMDKTITARFAGARVSAAANGKTYAVGGRSIAVSTVTVGGRPAVLYVDVPAGASTDVIDVSKVTLK